MLSGNFYSIKKHYKATQSFVVKILMEALKTSLTKMQISIIPYTEEAVWPCLNINLIMIGFTHLSQTRGPNLMEIIPMMLTRLLYLEEW